MTTQDFKTRLRISLGVSRQLKFFYAAVWLTVFVSVLFANTAFYWKCILFLVLFLSALSFCRYFYIIDKVSAIHIDDRQFQIIYKDQTIPVTLCGNPIVTEFYSHVPFVRSEVKKKGIAASFAMWISEISEWFWLPRNNLPRNNLPRNNLPRDNLPRYFPLAILADNCSANERSQLRTFLLSYSPTSETQE